MLKKLAFRWAKALRSGDFKQASGGLAKTDFDGKVLGHCCLGVLGEIKGLNQNGELDGEGFLEGELHKLCGLRTEQGTPKDDVKIKVRTKNALGNKRIYKEFEDLASANDSGVSFKIIATWIEKNYKLL